MKRMFLIAAALLLVGGGVAWATIPNDGGVINACYARSGGSLRVIDASVTNCKSTETALSWNQQGAQGPQGVRLVRPARQGRRARQASPGTKS